MRAARARAARRAQRHSVCGTVRWEPRLWEYRITHTVHRGDRGARGARSRRMCNVGSRRRHTRGTRLLAVSPSPPGRVRDPVRGPPRSVPGLSSVPPFRMAARRSPIAYMVQPSGDDRSRLIPFVIPRVPRRPPRRPGPAAGRVSFYSNAPARAANSLTYGYECRYDFRPTKPGD